MTLENQSNLRLFKRGNLIALVVFGCIAAGCADDARNAPNDMLTVPPDIALDGVMCGSMTCTGVDQNCCIDVMNDTASATCVFPGDCSGGGVLNCDGPEDCGSQLCCGTLSFNGGTNPDGGASILQAAHSSCGTCDFNLNQVPVTTLTTRLCHSDAECAGLTAFGHSAQCCTSTVTPLLHFCAVAISGITCP